MSHIVRPVVPTTIAPVAEPTVAAVPVVETPVAVSPIPVVETSNVQFAIEGTKVVFQRTNAPIDNRTIFETFDLARAAAIQAFAHHKNDVMAAINVTEKELLVISEAETLVATTPVV
jgi:hypothetical protein